MPLGGGSFVDALLRKRGGWVSGGGMWNTELEREDDAMLGKGTSEQRGFVTFEGFSTTGRASLLGGGGFATVRGVPQID